MREQTTGKKGVLLDHEVTLLRKSDRRLRLLAMPHLDALASQILSLLQQAAEQLNVWQPSETPSAEAVDASPAPDQAAAAN